MPRAQREALRNTPITEVKKLGKGHVLNPYEGACRKPITPPEAGGGGGGATRRDAAENPVVEGWGTNVKLKAQFCARAGTIYTGILPTPQFPEVSKLNIQNHNHRSFWRCAPPAHAFFSVGLF